MNWRPVVGFEGRYEVSDEGQVRGLRRGRLLRPYLVKGYPTVHLSSPANARKVHQLVLEAFVGPCPPGMQARHFPDPDRTNARLNNLSWATPLVNQRDRDTHGTHNRGRGRKLDAAAVKRIRAVKSWPHGTLLAIAREYGVSSTHILRVKRNKAWEHVQ